MQTLDTNPWESDHLFLLFITTHELTLQEEEEEEEDGVIGREERGCPAVNLR